MKRMLTILGLCAVLYAVMWCAVIAHGFQAEPAGYILASGKLEAAPTDTTGDGYFTVGESLTLMAHPKGIPNLILREHEGAEITVTIRRKQPKVLQEVKR
jgi:hypothetical protein